MKHYHILLFLICFSLSGFTQESPELKSTYNQVVDVLKNYDIIPEIEKKGDNHHYYKTKSIKIVYNYPNLEISFYFELNKGVWTSENLSGTYKLICPINSTKFEAQDSYDKENAYLNIKNSDGIELVFRGKRKLIENYYFYSTKLTIKKLCNKLSDLQRLLIAENYKGSLGISNNLTSTSNTFTYYKTADFAIKKVYQLEENTLFLDMSKQISPSSKIIAAYQCAQNREKNNPNLINIININVYEITTPTQSLEEYKKALSSNKISYISKTWKGLTGVEYTIRQDMGEVMVPTKVFYGFKGNKFYLIQLGSLTDYVNKFSLLLNSIKIL